MNQGFVGQRDALREPGQLPHPWRCDSERQRARLPAQDCKREEVVPIRRHRDTELRIARGMSIRRTRAMGNLHRGCLLLLRCAEPCREDWIRKNGKEMGNEEYKKEGNFAEAVALYDGAILMESQKAVHWSNKAAALIGLGKLLDAVAECREAVRLYPSFLLQGAPSVGYSISQIGEADRALQHYKLSKNEASRADIS